MSMQKKLRVRGLLMLVAFFGLLIVVFSPVFPGQRNGLDYMDNLFNTISKGSSYFIPDWVKASDQFAGKMIDVKVALADEQQAVATAKLFQASGAEVTINGKELGVKGDIAGIMKGSLADADQMYHNNGAAIAAKYGYNEREVLFNWWTAFKSMGKDLTNQKSFKQAKAIGTIQAKALEPAYNYYGVEAGNYKDSLMLIVTALLFYVCYTLWYGFGIMYLFEGLGLKIGH